MEQSKQVQVLDAANTDKIKTEIRNKLAQIGVPMKDDSLTEYILSMVANRKTREQIAQELVVFINENAEPFSHWLWDMLISMSQPPPQAPVEEQKPKSRIIYLNKSKAPANETEASRRLLSSALQQAAASTATVKLDMDIDEATENRKREPRRMPANSNRGWDNNRRRGGRGGGRRGARIENNESIVKVTEGEGEKPAAIYTAGYLKRKSSKQSATATEAEIALGDGESFENRQGGRGTFPRHHQYPKYNPYAYRPPPPVNKFANKHWFNPDSYNIASPMELPLGVKPNMKWVRGQDDKKMGTLPS
eukprot:GEZU01018769.1.p1 GENE.GEZU01018769.1~~GEZU01018769.1.p1  ORF type:complete len:306 (+),score=50.83 GEZU01018769.1:41-958(+)